MGTKFKIFVTAETVTLLGSSMAPVALTIAVLQQTNSASSLGIVLAARSVPMVVLLLLGGVLADRLPRAVTLTVCSVLAGLTQIAVAAVLFTDAPSIAAIAALEAVNGTVTAFSMPAMRGIVPELVEEQELRRANSRLATLRNTAELLGPAIAGAVAAIVSPAIVLLLDGLTFLVAALLFARIPLPRVVKQVGPLARGLAEGWRSFVSMRWLWTSVAGFSILNAVQAGVWLTVAPQIVIARDGPAIWGLVVSASGVGMIAGSMAVSRLNLSLRAGMTAFMLMGAPLAAVALSSHAWALLIAAVVGGTGAGVIIVVWETALQNNVPRDLLARAASYDELGSRVSVPVGQVTAGPLAAQLGSAAVCAAGSALFVVVPAVLALLAGGVLSGRAHQPVPNDIVTDLDVTAHD